MYFALMIIGVITVGKLLESRATASLPPPAAQLSGAQVVNAAVLPVSVPVAQNTPITEACYSVYPVGYKPMTGATDLTLPPTLQLMGFN